VKLLSFRGFVNLAHYDSKRLLPLQRAVLQDPSKASGLAKLITCAQAFWFCSQCIARLSQNMAVSLLELNTFAHCISAFFIYVFWWHKPYDVATHAYIDMPLDTSHHDLHDSSRRRNMHEHMLIADSWTARGIQRLLTMELTFLLYGALHALAWQYQFPTYAEEMIWRCACVATASSGLIVLIIILRDAIWLRAYENALTRFTSGFLCALFYFLCCVAIAARSFLVIESFRALPNSPASIYEVPRWTAYIPHI
jgi:hypothetical protein